MTPIAFPRSCGLDCMSFLLRPRRSREVPLDHQWNVLLQVERMRCHRQRIDIIRIDSQGALRVRDLFPH
jgi:hypothetical protein